MTNFAPLAILHSPYKEKFAVPRQPGLVPSAKAELEILPPYDDINAFNGLEVFSHLWLIFEFHKNTTDKWSPTVRPPRLGGNKRVGVFATRSPNRPNSIGLSLVKFHGLIQRDKKLFLSLSNIDLVDSTPIIDIKPYIPYADALPDAKAGFAQEAPETILTINFSEQANLQLKALTNEYIELKQFIIEVLQQDPRPAYKKLKPDSKVYAMHLSDFNIKWQCALDTVSVLSIKRV
ncbi:tRNA (N6-threonylcarbamoyladenosine(37)-N6)-methyltransferase TrmO [Psychromonas sp. RZ22]|uniref:tRNA (N6-threonylcarbamoyladenosine(37)-N6)-methyltransferase TrmO n=1 Tax=Psychromonas algarum TaxID=2555643 RepID=UPI0010684636|nr:tRNA (N6-threonylcarbamoyladenosine(37)-N6)-methyltransferase TrmO [Psychromonas sp. RZ22]TEW54557.1 tRNA (N6-threonylcarbamoyladenosine(37)-N6)-methyltransferase TrmO [Psychromonas sp. RZ22]